MRTGSPSLTVASGLLAEPEPREAANDDVLADLDRHLAHEVADGLRVLPDVRLIEEHGLLEERVELALDDAHDDVVGLAGGSGLLLVDLPLARDHLGRHVVPRDPPGITRCDLHGHLAGQAAELVRASHEVRLAVHLDEHADAALAVDVGIDDSLRRLPAHALPYRGQALGPQDLPGAFDIATRFDERSLAIHHPGPGLLAQEPNDFGRDRHRVRHRPLLRSTDSSEAGSTTESISASIGSGSVVPASVGRVEPSRPAASAGGADEAGVSAASWSCPSGDDSSR